MILYHAFFSVCDVSVFSVILYLLWCYFYMYLFVSVVGCDTFSIALYIHMYIYIYVYIHGYTYIHYMLVNLNLKYCTMMNRVIRQIVQHNVINVTVLFRRFWCCIVLYCIVLYCIVLYCIVLYCIVLCCIVQYSHLVHSVWYKPWIMNIRQMLTKALFNEERGSANMSRSSMYKFMSILGGFPPWRNWQASGFVTQL